MGPFGEAAKPETADGQDLVRAVIDFAERIDYISSPSNGIIGPKNGEQMLHRLAELAVTVERPSSPGWPLGMEAAAAKALVLLTNDSDDHYAAQIPGHERAIAEVFSEGPWVDVFRVTELLVRVRATESITVGLWNVRRLRLPPRPRGAAVLFFALRAQAEWHTNPHNGWHIHPEEDGRHLGYRCFFDATRTQADLCWEKHGEQGGRNATPWLDPAYRVLPSKTAVELHAACLKAVSAQGTLAPRRAGFRVWASRFGQPVRDKAYYAHPPVSPPVPKPWY